MTRTPAAASSTVFGVNTSQLLAKIWGFRQKISKRFLLLEFGPSSLTLVEAKQGEQEVQFEHFRRMELPPEAVERGVPADPALMGALIRELCKEEKIPAHRVAVVLPPEAAYTTVVHLPAELPANQAAAYASDPASGLQIPIPLQQTDFDLIPLEPSAAPAAPAPGLRPYFLASVPQKLVEQLLATLSAAQMELHRLEFGFNSQMRLYEADLLSLQPGEYLLQLELLPDCSHATVISAAGPLRCERMAAVREFPEPQLSAENAEAAATEGIAAEAITLKDERYLPVSELDLRVLCREIKQLMQRTQELMAEQPCRWQGVKLCGINSAHPGIADLLATELQLPVDLLRPLAAEGVGTVVLKTLLVQQGLGRLMGLGLGLLPPRSGPTCPIHREPDAPPRPTLFPATEATEADVVIDQPAVLTAFEEVVDAQLLINEPEPSPAISAPASTSFSFGTAAAATQAEPEPEETKALEPATSSFSLDHLWSGLENSIQEAEPSTPEDTTPLTPATPEPEPEPPASSEPEPAFDINDPSTWPSIKLQPAQDV